MKYKTRVMPLQLKLSADFISLERFIKETSKTPLLDVFHQALFLLVLPFLLLGYLLINALLLIALQILLVAVIIYKAVRKFI